MTSLSLEGAYATICGCHDPRRLFGVFLVQDRWDWESVAVWSIYYNGKLEYLIGRYLAYLTICETYPELHVGLYDRDLGNYDFRDFLLDVRTAQRARIEAESPYGWILHKPLQVNHDRLQLLRRRWPYVKLRAYAPEYQRKEKPGRAWRNHWTGIGAAADMAQARALGNQRKQFNPHSGESSGRVTDFTVVRARKRDPTNPYPLRFK